MTDEVKVQEMVAGGDDVRGEDTGAGGRARAMERGECEPEEIKVCYSIYSSKLLSIHRLERSTSHSTLSPHGFSRAGPPLIILCIQLVVGRPISPKLLCAGLRARDCTRGGRMDDMGDIGVVAGGRH